MCLAIAKAIEEGSRAVCCASTGNTSASAAAYAARAGLRCIMLVPTGGVALGKLAQGLIHGAEVLELACNFDEALEVAKKLCDLHAVTLVNSVNPFRIEGQKTCAFEILDSLGRAPDYQVMPVGNAGNISAHWLGYSQGGAAPVMFGIQASGAAPLVTGRRVDQPTTLASAIRIGNPASWELAVQAVAGSAGAFLAVTDAEILEAYHVLASEEGIFCEPASAASLAGFTKLLDEGRLERDKTCVLILTGHGLKDPDRALAEAPSPKRVPADVDTVAGLLGW